MRQHNVIDSHYIRRADSAPLAGADAEFDLPRRAAGVGAGERAEIHAEGLPGIGVGKLVVIVFGFKGVGSGPPSDFFRCSKEVGSDRLGFVYKKRGSAQVRLVVVFLFFCVL